MSEKIPSNIEREKILSEREILSAIEKTIGSNFEQFRRCEDENGLYILSVRTTDEVGDIVQCNYERAGSYPEGFSPDTIIELVFFCGGVQCGGRTMKRYRGGVWVPEVG